MTWPVGPRGLSILIFVALVGLALAVIGWTQRDTGLVASKVGGLGGSLPAHTAAAASATPTVRASATPPVSSAPQASPSAQPGATASAGPLLSSEPYASFAYLVWPGSPDAAAQQAMAGLTISVTRQAGGISVQAGVVGQPLPSARFYAAGGKVYVIEATTGDDSGNVDYNLGDDALVVTNLQGQIVQ